MCPWLRYCWDNVVCFHNELAKALILPGKEFDPSWYSVDHSYVLQLATRLKELICEVKREMT